MKYLKPLLLVTLMFGFTITSFAQRSPQRNAMPNRPGPGMFQRGNGTNGNGPMSRIPNLTDDQQQQIQQIQLNAQQQALSLRNQLREQEAHLRTLTTGDNINMDEANQVIDQIGSLRTQLMKQQLSTRMQVRNVLTDEQKVVFDTHPFIGSALGGGRGFRFMRPRN